MSRRLIPEPELVPFAAGEPPGRRWLYLAPHPDDEALGGGGTVIKAVRRGVTVRVAVVTDGAGQGAPEVRRRETEAAAQVMGVSEVRFLGFADRSLTPDDRSLRAAIRALIDELEPDLLLVPAPVDLHPDHRAVAMAARSVLVRLTLAGLRRCPVTAVAAYEVALPILPTTLVDIDDVWDAKCAAVACHGSQLAVRPYDRVMEGLAAVRSLTLTGVAHAEALHVVPTSALVRGTLRRWVRGMAPSPGLAGRARLSPFQGSPPRRDD